MSLRRVGDLVRALDPFHPANVFDPSRMKAFELRKAIELGKIPDIKKLTDAQLHDCIKIVKELERREEAEQSGAQDES